ncbi:MAG: hypothetical protein OQJ98_00520 [Candidatus Pacebacteria bacterium]|nr:hypothetical protein [Candidatus Paceibacterota bacterium]
MLYRIAKLVMTSYSIIGSLLGALVGFVIFLVIYILPLLAFIINLCWTPVIAIRAFGRLGKYGVPFGETWRNEIRETKKAWRDVVEGFHFIFCEAPQNIFDNLRRTLSAA